MTKLDATLDRSGAPGFGASAESKGALDGVLVIAIEQAVAAPTCTVRLADAGARVIKVERAGGETARHYDQSVGGFSAYFAWLNRGKESVCLDLKNEDDLALVHRMVGNADVLVQNLAPGAAARLGLGGKDLLKKYPCLIVADIVGYGQDTPYRDMRAYDMLIQAESGICAVTGTPEVPSKVGVSIADISAGMNAHAAILEALIARDRTGQGRAIEIAMFDCMADWMAVPLLHYVHDGHETARHGLSHASIYPYSLFNCEGGSIAVAIQQQSEWSRFCTGVLRMPELIDDPRYRDNPLRVHNRNILDQEILPALSCLPIAEMIERLNTNKIAWGRMSTVPNVAEHPALRKLTIPSPRGGSYEVPRPAGRSDLVGRPVPEVGADTDRIRATFAR